MIKIHFRFQVMFDECGGIAGDMGKLEYSETTGRNDKYLLLSLQVVPNVLKTLE